MSAIDDSENGTKTYDIPSLACDCHMHIFGPRDRYPYDEGRVYTPPEASIDEYIALRERLGVQRVVVVQPSVYGSDNRCQTDAMAQIPNTRGVAVIDGGESDRELERLHEAGFRGARINLEQGAVNAPIETVLGHLGARLKDIGWHLQMFTDVETIAALAPILRRFPVPVMFDHYAKLSPWGGPAQPGFETIVELLKGGGCWMKLSAPYYSRQSDFGNELSDARRTISALIDVAPTRLVWGSNWPHPNVVPGMSRSDPPIAPFREADDVSLLGMFVGWVADDAVLRTILVDNPARFYDF